MQPVIPPPAAWTKRASCVGMVGGDFDPWHGDGPQHARELLSQARLICLGCPVQVECTRYGLEQLTVDSVHGMYGAMAPDELRTLARMLGRPSRRVAAHGTRTRYINEKCRCPDCVAANTLYEGRRRSDTAPLCAAYRCRERSATDSQWCRLHRSRPAA